MRRLSFNHRAAPPNGRLPTAKTGIRNISPNAADGPRFFGGAVDLEGHAEELVAHNVVAASALAFGAQKNMNPAA